MPTKLTYEQAVAIRLDPRLHRDIAAEYGVTQAAISNIFTGRAWRSVDIIVPPRKHRRNRALTPGQVREVRASKDTAAVLSARYGVSRTCIQRIIRGETYKT